MKINLGFRFSMIVSVALVALLSLSACGINILGYIAPGKDEPAVKVEDAKILMDEKDYSGAAKILNELKDDSSKDSNEVRLMLAAANLGISGLDIWSVIGTALEGTSGGSSSVFDSLGELLGEGEEKDAKIQALQDAIDDLKTAPDPEAANVKNTGCFLAGIMIVPTIADATAAVTSLQTAITAASSGDCDGASGLSTAIGDISESAIRFSLVLETAVSCPFLAIDTSSVEGVNGSLKNLTAGADKGCDTGDFPDGIEQLLPACIRTAAGIPNSTATAGDSKIDACEIVLHCNTASDCF